MIHFKIYSSPCNLELDAGRSRTDCDPRRNMAERLGAVPLRKSNVTLKSFSGHSRPVIRETAVHVKYGKQEIDLPIVVTKEKGVALMGRDWLSKIRLASN